MDILEVFWDSRQQQQIAENSLAAGKALSKAREATDRLSQLELSVSRLSLICRALWEILQREHGLTDEQLLALISEIDLRDGHLDGKLAARKVNYCPHCGKAVSPKQPRCIYCGRANVAQDPF